MPLMKSQNTCKVKGLFSLSLTLSATTAPPEDVVRECHEKW